MPSQSELLRRLSERFVLGEISLETFTELRSRLATEETAGLGETPPSTGQTTTPAGMSVQDSVIKGNLTNLSVGNINMHVGAPDHLAGREINYERFIFVILRAGGSLVQADAELDQRRQELGLSVRQAGEIERACVEAHRARMPACRGADRTTPPPAPPPLPARSLPPPVPRPHAAVPPIANPPFLTARPCPRCRQPMPPGKKFCTACGNRLF